MNRFQSLSVIQTPLYFLGRLFLAGAHLLAITTVAWLILRLYPGDRWTPVRLGNYFAPWIFMALPCGVVIALLGHRRWLSRLLTALVVIMALQYWPLVIPREAPVFADTEADRLRVMTFNVNFKNHNVEGVAELIEAEKPDIIAFQEMTEAFAAELHNKIRGTHRYMVMDDSWALKMVLVSRYPIEVLPKHPDAVRAQHALVKTPSGSVVIWNVHPNPAVTKGWDEQGELLAVVAADVATEVQPVIVLGDFNTTDQTENYQTIADQLTDVHWAVGQGFGFTFPDLSRAISPDQPWVVQTLLKVDPLLRIDHIFASQHFIPRKTHVVPNSYGSDHMPVVAELMVR